MVDGGFEPLIKCVIKYVLYPNLNLPLSAEIEQDLAVFEL